MALTTKHIKEEMKDVDDVKEETEGHVDKGEIYKCTSPNITRTYSMSMAEKYGFTEKDTKEFNLITHLLKPIALKTPNKCALWISDGIKSIKLSYSELLLKSQHLANALHFIGSPKCAMVILSTCSPWWIINVSASFTGMIICPGTTMLTEREVLSRLECCNADTIFCSSDLMNKYDEHTKHISFRIVVEENEEDLPSVLKNGWRNYHDLLNQGRNLLTIEPINDGDAIAQMFFSSGTTGKPKVIQHTQVAMGIGSQECSRDIFSIRPSDVLWTFSDLGWMKSTLTSFYIPLSAGCTIFQYQMSRFDPNLVVQVIQKEPITLMCCPATALRDIIQEDMSPIRSSKLTRIYSGGESLNVEVIDSIAKHTGVPIYELYGQTEISYAISTKPGESYKPGSMGKSLFDYDLIIVDDNYNEVEHNKIGQIAISLKKSWPYGLFKEYYNNPEKTKEVFVNGLYLTGDKAYRDEEGYFWYIGRSDDIILSAGCLISPFEVESALLEHPSVKESAVVASPDALRGHMIKVFIVLTHEYSIIAKDEEGISNLKKDIKDFIKHSLAAHIYPRKMEFVESLPKTVTGKINRAELREKESLNN